MILCAPAHMESEADMMHFHVSIIPQFRALCATYLYRKFSTHRPSVWKKISQARILLHSTTRVQSYSIEGIPAYLFFVWVCTVISRTTCIWPSSSCSFTISGVIFPVLVHQHWQAISRCVPRRTSATIFLLLVPIPNAILLPPFSSFLNLTLVSPGHHRTCDGWADPGIQHVLRCLFQTVPAGHPLSYPRR